MGSAFFGLDTALRALRANQQAIEVTSHNVANANTPGFSRQIATLATTPPYAVTTMNRSPANSQIGTGVAVTDVSRSRAAFLDYQIRRGTSTLGQWTLARDTVQQVEAIFNEPSDSGINQLLDRFWQSWQSLANNPQDRAIRSSVVDQATTLTTTLARNVEQIEAISDDIRQQVSLRVADINGLAQQIASLNTQIAGSEVGGDHANDLRDARDQLVDRLANIVGISTAELANGEVGIYIGGHPLVDRSTVNTMSVEENADGFMVPTWSVEQLPVQFQSGELQALGELQSVDIPAYRSSLDTLALRLRDSVNALHASGYGLDGSTGNLFFTGTDAKTLTVSEAVAADTAKIATARAAGKPGDAGIALAIAQIQHSQVALSSSSTVVPGRTLSAATGVMVLGIDVTKAQNGKTYSITSPGLGQLTLSDGTTSQTVTVSDMTAAGVQVLSFSDLGVSIVLGNGGTGADTAANIIASLVGSLSTRADLSTLNQDYQTFIANLGVDGRSAKTMATNQDILVKHLDRQREAISGVSLDDEAVNLVRFQHAYQAAARVMTAMDEMLDRLINGTGAVGR